jgi:RNA polymerase sigma-70 factor, ECF subfamily
MSPRIEMQIDQAEFGDDPSSGDRCARLVESCLGGREGDFAELVALTEPVVRRLLGRLTPALDDVDDLVQETYLRAWRRLGQFRGDSRFTTWLYRIAVNVTHNWRRGRKPTLALTKGQERSIAAPPDLGDDALLIAYARALDHLPTELRATFVLHEAEGLSYKEVAETLGCPIGTVMSRLHRARARILDDLRDRLEEISP